MRVSEFCVAIAINNNSSRFYINYIKIILITNVKFLINLFQHLTCKNNSISFITTRFLINYITKNIYSPQSTKQKKSRRHLKRPHEKPRGKIPERAGNSSFRKDLSLFFRSFDIHPDRFIFHESGAHPTQERHREREMEKGSLSARHTRHRVRERERQEKRARVPCEAGFLRRAHKFPDRHR